MVAWSTSTTQASTPTDARNKNTHTSTVSQASPLKTTGIIISSMTSRCLIKITLTSILSWKISLKINHIKITLVIIVSTAIKIPMLSATVCTTHPKKSLKLINRVSMIVSPDLWMIVSQTLSIIDNLHMSLAINLWIGEVAQMED